MARRTLLGLAGNQYKTLFTKYDKTKPSIHSQDIVRKIGTFISMLFSEDNKLQS